MLIANVHFALKKQPQGCDVVTEFMLIYVLAKFEPKHKYFDGIFRLDVLFIDG